MIWAPPCASSCNSRIPRPLALPSHGFGVLGFFYGATRIRVFLAAASHLEAYPMPIGLEFPCSRSSFSVRISSLFREKPADVGPRLPTLPRQLTNAIRSAFVALYEHTRRTFDYVIETALRESAVGIPADRTTMRKQIRRNKHQMQL